MISVVIPTFNASKTIEAAISSVLDQLTPPQLIVVDGGSTDDTVGIVERLAPGSVVASGPDRGPYDAMNIGLDFVREQWVYFLGADDVLLRTLHEVRRYLKNSETNYYGDVVLMSRRKHLRGPSTWARLSETNICQQAIFYSRLTFTDRRFSLKYPVLADWAFNLEAWHTSPFRYIPVTAALYSGTGLSMTTPDSAFLQDRARLIRGALDSATAKQWARRRLAELAESVGHRAAKAITRPWL